MTLYDSIIKKGEEKGMQKGMQKGIQKGMQKGKIIGKQEGMESTIEIFQLLKDGQSPQAIADKLSIPMEFIIKVKRLLDEQN